MQSMTRSRHDAGTSEDFDSKCDRSAMQPGHRSMLHCYAGDETAGTDCHSVGLEGEDRFRTCRIFVVEISEADRF